VVMLSRYDWKLGRWSSFGKFGRKIKEPFLCIC
jgi:hypothetical protein